MKQFKTPILWAVGLLLMAVFVNADDSANSGKSDRQKPSTATATATPGKTVIPAVPAISTKKPGEVAQPAPLATPSPTAKTGDAKLIESTIDKALNVVKAKPARPDHTEKAERSGPSNDIKKLIDQFKDARNAFLDQEKELRQKYNNASKEEREKLREQIKEKRQVFLDQQKEARDELRKRLDDVKDQLKDHREVIDAAKDQAKDEVKHRKGGGD